MTASAETSASAASSAAAYNASESRLRAALAAFVAHQFASVPDYHDAGAEAFTGAVTPVVMAAQRTMGSLTAAYLGRLVGQAAPSVPVDAMSGALLRHGADPAEVYRRPFVTVWTDLSEGKPFTRAVAAGAARAQTLAATDVQLAKTHTAQRILRHAPVAGYRRQLGPDPHHCALCLLTSDRVYHKADLMPLHPGCSCTPVPVVAGQPIPAPDPASVHAAIRDSLGARYVQAGGRGAVSYRDIVIVHQHGELGPVLGVRGQQFTGSHDLTHDTGR